MAYISWEEERATVDFIMLMFGAPIVKLEVDREQIEKCIYECGSRMEKLGLEYDEHSLKDGVFAMMSIIVGSLRGKNSLNGMSLGYDPESARQMYEHGIELFYDWNYRLHKKAKKQNKKFPVYLKKVESGPPDDEISIQQRFGNGDGGDLSKYYKEQFVQNESTSTDRGTTTLSVFEPLEHGPYFCPSAVGTVYVGTQAVATFQAQDNNEFFITPLGNPQPELLAGDIDQHGVIRLSWSAPPGPNHANVSYEYSIN